MKHEHKVFLDKLKDGGMINPFDMTPLLKKQFNISDYIKASDIVYEWVTWNGKQENLERQDEIQEEATSMEEKIEALNEQSDVNKTI